MKHSLIIKTITLLGFLFLFGMFIFYRTGKFEMSFSKRSELAMNDTIPPKPDSTRSLRASSSKSLILTDDYKNKSFLEIERKIDSIEARRKKAILLSSSKSGSVFTADKPATKVDVSKLRSQTDTSGLQEVNVIGYSTKSAAVFSPKDLKGSSDTMNMKRRNDSIRARYKYLLDSLEKAKAE